VGRVLRSCFLTFINFLLFFLSFFPFRKHNGNRGTCIEVLFFNFYQFFCCFSSVFFSIISCMTMTHKKRRKNLNEPEGTPKCSKITSECRRQKWEGKLASNHISKNNQTPNGCEWKKIGFGAVTFNSVRRQIFVMKYVEGTTDRWWNDEAMISV